MLKIEARISVTNQNMKKLEFSVKFYQKYVILFVRFFEFYLF